VRRSARIGIVAGVAIVYFCAVGMVGSFAARHLVGATFTLGRLLLVLPPLIAGFVAARQASSSGTSRSTAPLGPTLAAGIVGGAGCALVVAAAVGLTVWIGVTSVRGVFLAVTDQLVAVIVVHASSTALGLLEATVVTVGLGTIGAALRIVPRVERHAVVGASAAVAAMGLLQRVIPTAMLQLNLSPTWLYDRRNGGLTTAGAALIFVLAFGGIELWQRRGEAARDRYARATAARADGSNPARGVLLVLLAVVLLAVPHVAGSVVTNVLGTVGIFLLLGLGLNVLVGNAGMLHLGFAFFFVLGAYATAVLTGAHVVTALGLAPPVLPFTMPFYLAVPIVVALGGLFGVITAAPTVRLRGDYLAIVTLGFGAIAQVFVQSTWLQGVVGGPQGMTGVPPAPLFGIEMRSPEHFYYLAVIACVIAVFVSWRLVSSRVGRAWNAMREDEQVAETMGIDVVRYKLLASAIGGLFGALGGALYAVQIGSLTSQSFSIYVSITALAIVILGGLGSVRGAVAGAFILVGLPQLISEFDQYQLLIYGAALIAIMLFRPQGLLPNVRIARELQEEDRAQDQWLREHDPDAARLVAAEEGRAIADDAAAAEGPIGGAL
jgi:branched-chain amino acid transport system permease protein